MTEEFKALPYLSISRILQMVYPVNEDIPEWIINKAGKRGKAVHDYIDKYYKGEKTEIPLEIGGYIDSFKSWEEERKNRNLKVMATELELIDHELEIKGIIDIILADDDLNYMLGDFKTNSHIDREMRIKQQLQLSFYKYLWERTQQEGNITSCKIIHLQKTKYKELEYKPQTEIIEGLIKAFKFCYPDGIKDHDKYKI